MKTTYSFMVFCLCCLTALAQNSASKNPTPSRKPAETPWQTTERGPNHRVWERTVYETNRFGVARAKIHRYTELGSGIHYLKDGEWHETKEQILPLPGGIGAAATNGAHKVFFPSDIYSGQIEIITPDGEHLHNRPLGIAYFDGEKSVLIAELTNSIGQILPSGNQIIYTNAFTDVAADLVGTYRRNSFESDLVFRSRPPAPEEYGLNPATARLGLLTEFFDARQPAQIISDVSKEDGLFDTGLSFGSMHMGRGKAFPVAKDRPLKEAQDTTPIGGSGKPVYKTWQKLEGRDFLIEEVPYRHLKPQFDPSARNSAKSQSALAPAVRGTASRKVALPKARAAVGTTNTVRFAQNELAREGVVMDYIMLASSNLTEFTFQSDSTYVISGSVYITNAIFEGGCVIKYARGSYLRVPGLPICKTDPYRPCIMTAYDDDSVGESLPGSAGSPSGGVRRHCPGDPEWRRDLHQWFSHRVCRHRHPV